MSQQKSSKYRQRGYVMTDGSVEVVYGNDAAPVGFVKQEWDNDVVEVTTATPHVEIDASDAADPAPSAAV